MHIQDKDLSRLRPIETIGELSDYYFPPYITLAHMFHAPKNWSIIDREMTQYVLQYVVDGFAHYPVGDRNYENTSRRPAIPSTA
jgi:hypothetical protein